MSGWSEGLNNNGPNTSIVHKLTKNDILGLFAQDTITLCHQDKYNTLYFLSTVRSYFTTLIDTVKC